MPIQSTPPRSEDATAGAPGAGRDDFVDGIRGMALLGILIVNVEFILAPWEIGWLGHDSLGDRFWRAVVIAFGQAKIYPLFAMLFGYGVSRQELRAERQGRALAPSFRRRSWGLFVLGALHGVLFFPGDILVLYALVGAVTFRFRRHPVGALWRYAGWIYGMASVFWLGLGVLDTMSGSPRPTEEEQILAAAETAQVMISGTWLDVLALHAVQWPITLGILGLVQGPACAAFFLVGMAVGREGATPLAGRCIGVFRRFWGFVVVAVGVAIAGSWLTLEGGRWETLGFALGFVAAPGVALGYLGGLAALWNRRRGWISWLASPGRMSLTVYLAESAVVTTLAYGYGWGWCRATGPGAGVALACLTWLALTVASVAWLARFRVGPAEWLLRSFGRGGFTKPSR